MKTITLNIGLETLQGNTLEVDCALSAIAACGVSIDSSHVVTGTWKGKEEQTLVIRGRTNNQQIAECLALAAVILCQDCIAATIGNLYGPNLNGYDFDPELFHSDKLVESTADYDYLSALPSKPIDNQAEEFISYLRETLIPDLYESGYEATADDFETLIRHYANK